MLTLQGGSFLSHPPYFLAYNLVMWRLRVNLCFFSALFLLYFFFFSHINIILNYLILIVRQIFQREIQQENTQKKYK